MNTPAYPFRYHLLAAAALLGLSLHTLAETIDVTDKQGRTISARLLGCEGKEVQFERVSDSKKFKVSMDALDDKTNSAVKAWIDGGGNLMEKFQVTMNTGKSGRTTAMEDFDDKRVNLKPVVTIKNPDANRETRPLKLTVLILGKPVTERSNIHVFLTETFDIPKIAPLRSQEFKLKAISSPYDDSNYSKFGSRYLGYVWVIHDEDDRIVDCASVPSALVGDKAKAFLRLQSNYIYDRDLKGR